MKKSSLALTAVAASLAWAAPAEAGVDSINHCRDGLFGNPESIRETRDCVVANVQALPLELRACTDGLGGNPESIGETRDCVVRELTD